MTTAERAPTVLDASALVELLLRSPRGQWFRSRLDWTRGVHAPELLLVETAAVLRRYELRGEISAERADVAFERMVTLPLSLVSTSVLVPDAWALRHHITMNDACYVDLARRLHAVLVTGDGRLARAHQLGVATLAPPDSTADDS